MLSQERLFIGGVGSISDTTNATKDTKVLAPEVREYVDDLGRGMKVRNRLVKYPDGTMLVENIEWTYEPIKGTEMKMS